jgi:hypothetical protein
LMTHFCETDRGYESYVSGTNDTDANWI